MMSDLDTYLVEHFLNAEQLATACKISVGELDKLVQNNLIPAPSYEVSDSSKVNSYVFGEMKAKYSISGQYFHPASIIWINAARVIVETYGEEIASEKIKERFYQNFQAALSDLNKTTYQLKDSFTDEGFPIDEGLKIRTDIAWEHFLKGTFGLCVANPKSEAAIALKEVLQEKLSQLSDDGRRSKYSPTEAQTILTLVDDFAEASMPFSPIEYHLSSRKRLVDDLRDQLGVSSTESLWTK